MWVDGADGAKIDVFIVKPHGFDPSRKYPLILNVHGGPQDQWHDAFRGDWQLYPGAGYVVAFANPHGSTGYGQDFTAQISGDWGGAVFEDLMKVTDALEKLPYVDADAHRRDGLVVRRLHDELVRGPHRSLQGHRLDDGRLRPALDVRRDRGTVVPAVGPQGTAVGQPAVREVVAVDGREEFQDAGLVITGERDYRVPYTQSLQFFTDLQKMKVPSRLIVYPNAGHWPSWYEMALYYTAHLEWFHKYLGGSAPPWTTEQFLRNAVFDKDGKRTTAAATAGAGGTP